MLGRGDFKTQRRRVDAQTDSLRSQRLCVSILCTADHVESLKLLTIHCNPIHQFYLMEIDQ